MSVASLLAQLRAGRVSPREAVQASLDRIERLDPRLNSFISVRGDEALAEAAALESAGGDRGLLWGLPVGIKDVIDVAGVPTTAASRILADNVPVRDATVVERLRAAGAIVVGKLNTHEFAYGALTTSPHYGPAHNPWATDRVCGGSSGGSGAAAAADLVPATLGTDTAGSIRIPACFCGVTGLRPTTGRVSNRGVVPVAWSFDTVGPIARSAEDCALLLAAIAGRDPGDPTTLAEPVPDYTGELARGARGLRVGIVSALFEGAIDGAVAQAVRDAVTELGRAGASIADVDLPHLELSGRAQQLIQYSEATAAHLPWLRTRLDEYGDDVRARLLTGLYLPPTAAETAQRVRRLAHASFATVLERVDVLAAPTMPILPPRIGEETVTVNGETVPYRLSLVPFNSPWACVGAPVVSVPAGFVDGLPVGLALIGRRFDEATVLRAAHAFQLVSDWHERRPTLAVDA